MPLQDGSPATSRELDLGPWMEDGAGAFPGGDTEGVASRYGGMGRVGTQWVALPRWHELRWTSRSWQEFSLAGLKVLRATDLRHSPSGGPGIGALGGVVGSASGPKEAVRFSLGLRARALG